ncbi:MAG: hypothetical protein WDN45_03515 [Caulobacteraceae bacterium]
MIMLIGGARPACSWGLLLQQGHGGGGVGAGRGGRGVAVQRLPAKHGGGQAAKRGCHGRAQADGRRPARVELLH